MVTPTTRAKACSPERLVEIPAGRRTVQGSLMLPPERRGIVVFAHGSGSGRFSPRNQFVAQAMRDVGMGTLLIDLLEEDEAQDRRNVFDIELLADRLEAAAAWLRRDHETQDLHLGYFGASTGAGAAARGRSPPAGSDRRSRLARWEAGSGRTIPAQRDGAYPAVGRRSRRGRHPIEPPSPGCFASY